jgi:guanylate kinase
VAEYKRGLLIVLSGPAGVGKDTLIERWQLVAPNLRRLVTYTTRPRTPGERHGLDYYFISEQEFQQMVQEGAFLEYAHVHGHWYGTPLREMQEWRERGYDVVLRIDVQGAMQVKQRFPEAVLIFVAPLRWKSWRHGCASAGVTTRQLSSSAWRMRARRWSISPNMTTASLNDDLNRALETLRCILIAERHRVRSQPREEAVAQSA